MPIDGMEHLYTSMCAVSSFRILYTSSVQSTPRILHIVLQYELIPESTILPLSNLITEITNNVEESATPTVTLMAPKMTHQVVDCNTPKL